MASSPEPSPVPFRTPASALHRASGGQPRNFEPVGVGPNVSFDENDMGEDMGMEEIDEDWVGKDWLRGVAELYASTEARGPHTTADLAEFVIRCACTAKLIEILSCFLSVQFLHTLRCI